ncbi:MAG: hypothetical protein WCE21_01620 [Candidatus Babeliales bacterium]
MKKTPLLPLIFLMIYGAQYAQDQNDTQSTLTNTQLKPYVFGNGIFASAKNGPQTIKNDFYGIFQKYNLGLEVQLQWTVFLSGIGMAASCLSYREKYPLRVITYSKLPIARTAAVSAATLYANGLRLSIKRERGALNPDQERALYESYALGHIAMLANRVAFGARFFSPLFFSSLAILNIYQAIHASDSLDHHH